MALKTNSDDGEGCPRLSVVVADDDPSVRRALAALVASDSGFELAGAAATVDETIELCRSRKPDLVVVDVQIPKGGGARAVREVTQASPASRILALSGFGDRHHVMQMLAAGAVGYMVKSATLDLLAALRAAGRGEGVLSPEVTGQVIHELSSWLANDSKPHRTRLEARDIRRTIDAQSYSVAFQPIFSLRQGTVVGVEALARLAPDLGLSPDLWFTEAWASGLGIELELAVLRMALEQGHRRPEGVFLSVNVSPQAATSSEFRALVLEAGESSGLVIELTEHSAIDDYEMLNRGLSDLRKRGVRVAVDDAGAGYASFRHVLRMNPDVIKLDMSLVTDIDDDPSKQALAAALVRFAANIHATVVAEGVETVSQLDCISSLGVDHGQGFYLGRPGPLLAVAP